MREAIEMVAFKTEKIRHPAERHFFERIMSADRMEKNEHRHHRICRIGKTDPPGIKHGDRANDDPYGEIFGEPCQPIERIECEDRKDNEIRHQQYKRKLASVIEFHDEE